VEENMKAYVHRASDWYNREIKEFKNLDELLAFVKEVDRIVLEVNSAYHAKPFPNKTMWEEYKEKGILDCPFEIIIYDDYLE